MSSMKSSMKSPNLLFVYGSLRRNADGAPHPLLREGRFLTAATVPGVLYRVNWYPGLVADEEGGSRVCGELFELPAERAAALLAALDDYEGSGFRRRQLHASAAGNSVGDAWVYEYVGPTQALALIPSGDYAVPVHRERP